MCKLTSFRTLVALIGFAGFINASIAHAQNEGAVQYPPLSIGEDAQPPPPARMVPQIVSPRRVEFGASGSSLPPSNRPYRVRPDTGTDPLLMQLAPLGRASPVPPPTGSGN